MELPTPPRIWAGRVLTAAYAPFVLWSVIGSAWTFVHHRFTLAFVLAFAVFITPSLIFKRTVGSVTVMYGIAGCHALAAFALHAWLRLPLWVAGLFLAASLTLLVLHAMRAMTAAGRR
jgi:hypothetical protein